MLSPTRDLFLLPLLLPFPPPPLLSSFVTIMAFSFTEFLSSNGTILSIRCLHEHQLKLVINTHTHTHGNFP